MQRGGIRETGPPRARGDSPRIYDALHLAPTLRVGVCIARLEDPVVSERSTALLRIV